jgi:hypothetical protein
MTQPTDTSEEPPNRKQRPISNSVSGINLPSGGAQFNYGHHQMQQPPYKVKKTAS